MFCQLLVWEKDILKIKFFIFEETLEWVETNVRLKSKPSDFIAYLVKLYSELDGFYYITTCV